MDPNSPRSRIVIPERRLQAIRQRWQEWQPALKVEQQARPSHICLDSIWHQNWLLSLLEKRIEMRVVRRLSLDDPRLPLSELQRRVRIYLEKRTRRKGNVPSTI